MLFLVVSFAELALANSRVRVVMEPSLVEIESMLSGGLVHSWSHGATSKTFSQQLSARLQGARLRVLARNSEQ